jgi:Plavaka transposase
MQNTISEDPRTHGAMLVPIVAGSDKTTVSVATGHQEYHPVYISPGNLTNTARRGHSNSVLPVAFLPIPKSKCPSPACCSLVITEVQPPYSSKQTPSAVSGISAICAPDVSHVFSTNFCTPQGSNDRT